MEQLSGGQRQKVWIGMALVQDTDVVLLDEPTSALDIGHQHEVLECIRRVCDLGKSVVMVIHDLAAAARFCDHLLAMRDGVVRHFGKPREIVNENLILSLYGVHVEILTARCDGSPVIVPVRLQNPSDR
jgi:iron complex transport system ATP-binding protein